MTPAQVCPVPSFRQLCVMAHHVFDRLGEAVDGAAVVDEMKWVCARARLDYQVSGVLCRAAEAVSVARKKGYRTPRRPGCSRRPGPDVWVAPSPFTRDELARADRWRRNIGQFSGCPHTAECGDWERCRAALIRSWRQTRRVRL